MGGGGKGGLAQPLASVEAKQQCHGAGGPRRGGGAGAAWQLIRCPTSEFRVGEAVSLVAPPAPREPDSPRRGGQSKQGPQSLSEPTAEDPFRFRLAGFGFVSSSSWKRWKGSPAGTSAAPFHLHPMLPVPLCTGGGSHRGTAGTRLFLSVGGLCGVLSTSGAGQSCFSPAFGWLGGRVLVFLGQGEEVAEPEGMENKLSEWGPHSSGAPHPFLGLMPRSLSNPMGLLVIKLVSGAGPSPRPSSTTSQGQGASLHLVGFVTARLDVLQSLENWGLAEN